MLAVEDSAKASSSSAWCWKMLVSVSEGTGAAPCAVASCGAAPGRVSSDGVQTDVGVTGGPMFAGVTSDVTSNESVPGSAPCKSQGTAAEVESEVMGDGDTTFLAASAAGGMSGRVSLTMFAGVGADGSSAPSRSRFLAGYVGGTGMEAAVAWRNSASASSRILTRALREARVISGTGREQHAA